MTRYRFHDTPLRRDGTHDPHGKPRMMPVPAWASGSVLEGYKTQAKTQPEQLRTINERNRRFWEKRAKEKP